MHSVIVHHLIQDFHPLAVVEAESCKVVEIHPHQLGEIRCLLRTEPGIVKGPHLNETTSLEVEIPVRKLPFHIGVKSQVAGQFDEEHEVEVGQPFVAQIQELDGAEQVVEHRRILFGFPEGSIQDFSQKQSDGVFYSIRRNTGEGKNGTHFFDALQRTVPVMVCLDFNQGQGLEKCAPQGRFLAVRLGDQVADTAEIFGIKVHDVGRIVVGLTVQNDGFGLDEHGA